MGGARGQPIRGYLSLCGDLSDPESESESRGWCEGRTRRFERGRQVA